MESRLLYSATKSLEKIIQWTSFEKGNEWIYFGALDEIDVDIVNSRISGYFIFKYLTKDKEDYLKNKLKQLEK